MSAQIQTTSIVYFAHSRNWRLNRNRNFCKGTQVSKIISGAKVDARATGLKKYIGCSRMSVTAICCFGCFWTRVHSKLATRLSYLCFTWEKVFFFSYCLISLHASQPIGPSSVQKKIPTTNNESIQSKSKKLFQVFTIASIREKFCRVPVPVYL